MSEKKKMGRPQLPDVIERDGLSYITLKMFSDIRKVSVRTIQKYIKDGKIFKGTIKEKAVSYIQVEIAEKELLENLDSRSSLKAIGTQVEIDREEKAGEQPPEKKKSKEEKEPRPKKVIEIPIEVVPGVATFAVSRAKTEQAKAELAQMELDDKKGKFLDRKAVEKQAFEEATRVRESLLNIPSRISAELAAMRDQGEVEIFLEREVREALSELSR